MKIEVWDADLAAPPDFMGQRTLLTSALAPYFSEIHTLPLAPRDAQIGKLLKKGKEGEKLGSIRVRTQYMVRKLSERCSAPELLKKEHEAIDMFKVLVRMLLTDKYFIHHYYFSCLNCSSHLIIHFVLIQLQLPWDYCWYRVGVYQFLCHLWCW